MQDIVRARRWRLTACEMGVELAGSCLDGDDEVQEERLSYRLASTYPIASVASLL